MLVSLSGNNKRDHRNHWTTQWQRVWWHVSQFKDGVIDDKDESQIDDAQTNNISDDMFSNLSCYDRSDVTDEDTLNSNKKICKIWQIRTTVIDDKFKKEDTVTDEILDDESRLSDSDKDTVIGDKSNKEDTVTGKCYHKILTL